MKLRVHHEADADYEEAYDWYFAKRQDLAEDFSLAVEQAVAKVAEAPLRFQEIEPGIRRCLVHGFPYGLIYEAGDDEVFLVCIMHLRRRPGYWRNRL